jgi:hypothetical protein
MLARMTAMLRVGNKPGHVQPGKEGIMICGARPAVRHALQSTQQLLTILALLDLHD